MIRFVYAYVFRLGFLDGVAGLYFCGLLAFYEFLIDAKAYEIKVNESLESGRAVSKST